MAAPTFVADEVVTAAKMNSLPKGQLGYAQITADQTGLTSAATAITGLSVTVTVVANRRIRLSARCGTTVSTVTADRGQMMIREGGTDLTTAVKRFDGTNGEEGLHAELVLTPTAGAHTYLVAYGRVSGTGSHTFGAATTSPAFLLVEDIGSV